MLALILLPVMVQIKPPPGFKVGVPKKDATYDRANFWEVSTRSGKLVIRAQSRLGEPKWVAPQTQVRAIRIKQPGFTWDTSTGYGVRFEDGELFGLDAGEWRGGLFFVKVGESTPEVLVKQNVKAFGVKDEKIYVLTGLAHLGMEDTAIYEVSRNEDWKVREIGKPSFVPPQACWSRGRFIVGGSGNPNSTSYSVTEISEMRLDGSSKVLAKFDGGKYRTESIVETSDGTIWLGGLGFVAAVQPGGKPVFFVPTSRSKKR